MMGIKLISLDKRLNECCVKIDSRICFKTENIQCILYDNVKLDKMNFTRISNGYYVIINRLKVIRNKVQCDLHGGRSNAYYTIID